MRRVLVLGAGGHGQVVADILLAAYRRGAAEVPVGFLDDDERLHGATVLGLPVLGPIAGWRQVEHEGAVLAIGDNATRRRLFLALQGQGMRFVSAVHPAAILAGEVRLGLGIAVCAGVVVNTGSAVADGAILNTGCTVDHHSRVGAFAHVAPGAHLGGNVTVGEGALVGIGSAVSRGLHVGEWAVLGAGSAVTRDVPARCLAAGVPARVIRQAPETRDD